MLTLLFWYLVLQNKSGSDISKLAVLSRQHFIVTTVEVTYYTLAVFLRNCFVLAARFRSYGNHNNTATEILSWQERLSCKELFACKANVQMQNFDDDCKQTGTKVLVTYPFHLLSFIFLSQNSEYSNVRFFAAISRIYEEVACKGCIRELLSSQWTQKNM